MTIRANLVGSLVTDEFKNVKRSAVYIDGYTILGTNSIVMPGCHLGEGVSLGASTLVTKSLDPWQIYIGQPARKLRPRSMNIVQNFQSFYPPQLVNIPFNKPFLTGDELSHINNAASLASSLEMVTTPSNVLRYWKICLMEVKFFLLILVLLLWRWQLFF